MWNFLQIISEKERRTGLKKSLKFGKIIWCHSEAVHIFVLRDERILPDKAAHLWHLLCQGTEVQANDLAANAAEWRGI